MSGFPASGGASPPVDLVNTVPTTVPFTIQQAPGQSADLLDILNSTGATKLVQIDSAGDLTVASPATTSVYILNVMNRMRDNGATFQINFASHLFQMISAGIQLSMNGGAAASILSSGSGAPGIAGSLGDMFFRTDTPSTANQRIYICTTAGAAGSAVWTGIL